MTDLRQPAFDKGAMEKSVLSQTAVRGVIPQGNQASHILELEFVRWLIAGDVSCERARNKPCCRATCAVVGRDPPSAPGQLAQSPSAKTLSSSFVCNVGITTICPLRLISRPPSFAATGGAFTPAAHTRNGASILCPPSIETPCSSAPTTFVPVRTSTPSFFNLSS